eukprot:313303-Prorocentrum_minimum.AAC.1
MSLTWQARAASLGGTVLLVFQPAEEGGAGAQKMLATYPRLHSARAMFGIHLAPWVPSGEVQSRA